MKKKVWVFSVIAALAGCRSCQGGKTMALVPVIDVQPTSLDFGQAKIGETAALKLEIHAASNATLHLSAVTVGGDPASAVVDAPAWVNGLERVAVSVPLTPAALRAYAATLVIASDDDEHPEVRVPLTGTGASGVIAVTPAAVHFMPEP